MSIYRYGYIIWNEKHKILVHADYEFDTYSEAARDIGVQLKELAKEGIYDYETAIMVLKIRK